jgi:hypothetical protein
VSEREREGEMMNAEEYNNKNTIHFIFVDKKEV